MSFVARLSSNSLPNARSLRPRSGELQSLPHVIPRSTEGSPWPFQPASLRRFLGRPRNDGKGSQRLCSSSDLALSGPGNPRKLWDSRFFCPRHPFPQTFILILGGVLPGSEAGNYVRPSGNCRECPLWHSARRSCRRERLLRAERHGTARRHVPYSVEYPDSLHYVTRYDRRSSEEVRPMWPSVDYQE